jgi:hypothetical protein
VDLIPGLAFTFATIIVINTKNLFISVGCYFIAFMFLSLHTYLINKLNNKE